jgi:hypothetical protein
MAACQDGVERALPVNIAPNPIEAIEAFLKSALVGKSGVSPNEMTEMLVFCETDLNLRDRCVDFVAREHLIEPTDLTLTRQV